jgi:cell division protein FtsL
MLAGFGAGRRLPIDLLGKVILNAISVVWMVYLASRFRPPSEA